MILQPTPNERLASGQAGKGIGESENVTRNNMQNCFINTVPQVSNGEKDLSKTKLQIKKQENCNVSDFDGHTLRDLLQSVKLEI